MTRSVSWSASRGSAAKRGHRLANLSGDGGVDQSCGRRELFRCAGTDLDAAPNRLPSRSLTPEGSPDSARPRGLRRASRFLKQSARTACRSIASVDSRNLSYGLLLPDRDCLRSRLMGQSGCLRVDRSSVPTRTGRRRGRQGCGAFVTVWVTGNERIAARACLMRERFRCACAQRSGDNAWWERLERRSNRRRVHGRRIWWMGLRRRSA